MTAKTTPPDPLDIIPDPAEVRRRLGATYREARLLRQQLKVAERCRDERKSVATLANTGDRRHA